MNTYLVCFRFHVVDQVVRRTWYEVETYAGPELGGAHWDKPQGPHTHWVSYVAHVPGYADADDYIDENLDHWADQVARFYFPRLPVVGHWERTSHFVR